MPLRNVSWEERDMEGEWLELKDKDALYFLGPELTLRRCTLVLRVPTKRLLISGARLIDCTVEVKQELKNFRWYSAVLQGCRFSGCMSGCDFGRWPDWPEEGSIEECDFTQAHLDGCRFIGCDASTLRFPAWPCFTLLDTFRRSRELETAPWPGRVRTAMTGFDVDPPATVAVSYSATVLAEQYGTTEEAIRSVLERLGGVRF